MPDPLAGLPPRFLRTPKPRVFSAYPAEHWKSIAPTAPVRSIGRSAAASSTRSMI